MPGISFQTGSGRYRNASRMRGNKVCPSFPTPSSTPTCIVFPYDKKKRMFITSNYSTSQTQNRASTEDIERFLAEVNEPVAAWFKEYRDAYECRGMYLCCLITLFFLVPIFFCYLCCYASTYSEAKKKKQEAEEQAKLIIREKSSFFHARGLVWNVPQHFPQWIELWTHNGGFHQPAIQMQNGQGGIQMVTVPQQQPNYSVYPMNVQQQGMYTANTYTA